MRFFAVIRTFIASYIVPGWGFWIVGKPKFALITVGVITGVALLFGWSRLVLDPIAYIVFACLIIGLIFFAALYAAIMEYRRDNQESPPRQWKSAILFAIVAAVLFYPLKSYRSVVLGYDIFRLPASSMAPTLVKGDYILADTWHYSDSDIAVGDLAVFVVPDSDGVIYVKRVVGAPGDELSFEDDAIVRNGERVEEPYAIYSEGPSRPGSSFPSVVVPEDEYFVMGDNRNNSRDSRFIGTIPRSDFVGRVVHLWYSRDDTDGVRWKRFPMKIN